MELVTSGGATAPPPSVVVAEVSSELFATFTATAPAFPPIAVDVEVEAEVAPCPRPPPGPTLGSPDFFPADLTGQSCLRCFLLPSHEWAHLQVFPARHPVSDVQYLQGLSMVAAALVRFSRGIVLDGVFCSF